MSETRREWKLPKNVRQVGDGGAERKIYIEDYVVTYLNQLTEKQNQAKAILIGTVKEKNLYPYIFIDGAMEVTDFLMSETQKEELEKSIEMQFGIKRIVGWFFAMQESPFMMNHDVLDIYKEAFGEENQVLLVLEKGDTELISFLMEEDMVVEQSGYYVYYDKNLPMQTLLINENKGEAIEKKEQVSDEAIHRFRKLIKKRQSEKKKDSFKGSLVYLAGGFLIMTVLSLGVTMIYNYDRMKDVEESLAQLTSHVDSQAEYVTDQVITEPEKQAEEVMKNVGEADSETALPESAVIGKPETEKQEKEAAQVSTETGGTETNKEKEETIQRLANQPTESSEEEVKKTTAAAPRSSYIVKVGDTLAQISQMYYGGTQRVQDICNLNGIDDENTILPGQKILLP